MIHILLFCISVWASPPRTGIIISVYDGDTFTLNTGDKIRLRGVNTPELRPKEAYGIEARDAAADFLLQKKVTLHYGEVKKDGYNRLIASVETKEGDVGTHLLSLGLGHIFLIPPESVDLPKMLKAQEEAQESKRGLWSNPRYTSRLHITSFHANGKGRDSAFVNGEYLRVCNISSQEVSTKGFRIRNLAGKEFTLPEIIIPVGHTVKIFSGYGRHQKNPRKQLEIYLGSRTPVWDNTHDFVRIMNQKGKIEDEREHKPKTPPKDEGQ